MTDSADLRAVFGLGNPGLAYRFHRHNAGFLFLERVLQDARVTRLEHRTELLSLVDWVAVGGARYLLVRPQTFMNLSGQAFESVLAAHGWVPRQALLVYDDLDLPLGSFRLRTRGASAGHRGVRSILEAARTTAVPRLRLGVGPRPPEADAADFVLADFTAADVCVDRRAGGGDEPLQRPPDVDAFGSRAPGGAGCAAGKIVVIWDFFGIIPTFASWALLRHRGPRIADPVENTCKGVIP